jgi:hypothetical protein
VIFGDRRLTEIVVYLWQTNTIHVKFTQPIVPLADETGLGNLVKFVTLNFRVTRYIELETFD